MVEDALSSKAQSGKTNGKGMGVTENICEWNPALEKVTFENVNSLTIIISANQRS